MLPCFNLTLIYSYNIYDRVSLCSSLSWDSLCRSWLSRSHRNSTVFASCIWKLKAWAEEYANYFYLRKIVLFCDSCGSHLGRVLHLLSVRYTKVVLKKGEWCTFIGFKICREIILSDCSHVLDFVSFSNTTVISHAPVHSKNDNFTKSAVQIQLNLHQDSNRLWRTIFNFILKIKRTQDSLNNSVK